MIPIGSLLERVKIVRASNAVAAGSTDSNGSGVDIAGFDGVLFIAAVGTLTANQVTALKAEQSSDNGSSDAWAEIAGSATAALDDDDDNALVVLDVFRPAERYVRPVVTRSTANAVIDGVIAILYHAHELPITADASVAASKAIADPVAGTA